MNLYEVYIFIYIFFYGYMFNMDINKNEAIICCQYSEPGASSLPPEGLGGLWCDKSDGVYHNSRVDHEAI